MRCRLHLGTKTNWLFWGQKVKGKGHSETTHNEISTLRGIFSPIFRMQGRILMKLITGSTWPWWHFQDHGFEGQYHRKHFPKVHFSGWGNTDWRFYSKRATIARLWLGYRGEAFPSLGGRARVRSPVRCARSRPGQTLDWHNTNQTLNDAHITQHHCSSLWYIHDGKQKLSESADVRIKPGSGLRTPMTS